MGGGAVAGRSVGHPFSHAYSFQKPLRAQLSQVPHLAGGGPASGAFLARTQSATRPGDQAAVDQSQAYFQRLQDQLQERLERQTFNEQFQQSESGRAAQGVRHARARFASPTNRSIEINRTVRRHRDKMEEQIKLLQKQIKDRKKQTQKQKVLNEIHQRQLAHQLDLNRRLENLAGAQEEGPEVQGAADGLQGSKMEDFVQGTLNEDANGDNCNIIMRDGPAMNGQAASQHPSTDSPAPGARPRPSQELDNLASVNSLLSQRQAGPATERGADPQSQALLLGRNSSSQSIRDFYLCLFSSDLQSTKERTVQELQILQN